MKSNKKEKEVKEVKKSKLEDSKWLGGFALWLSSLFAVVALGSEYAINHQWGMLALVSPLGLKVVAELVVKFKS